MTKANGYRYTTRDHLGRSMDTLKILRRGRSSEGGAWVWSILPCLKGEDPTMEERIARLASWERFVPGAVAPVLAHHRWHLFERPSP